MKKKLKPSDYGRPWDSIFKKMELELIAHNIMIIMARNDNKFINKPMEWDYYLNERFKDEKKHNKSVTKEQITWIEQNNFNRVKDYCINPIEAAKFCKNWE